MDFKVRRDFLLITILLVILTLPGFATEFNNCCQVKIAALRPAVQPGTSPDIYLVHGNSVEKVMLGKSMKEVYKLYPPKRIERVLIYDGKGSYEKIEILNRDRSEVLFFIEPDCSSQDSACIIKRINITSSTYHTKKNLRVGKYFVDLVKSGEKTTELAWFEGNLILRSKEAGLSYVLQTVNIPKPWYTTMNNETLPDSTKIIGMMITGKDLRGVSYQEVDSLNRKFQAELAVKKLSLAAKLLVNKQKVSAVKLAGNTKAKKGSKKKDTLKDKQVTDSGAPDSNPAAGALQSDKTLIPSNAAISPAQPAGRALPPLPPAPKSLSATDNGVLIESGSDTLKTKKIPDPSTIK